MLSIIVHYDVELCMRPFIRDLIAQLFLCCIALIIVRGPILHGDIFLLSVLFVLMPVGAMFGWYALIHLLLAGLGAYWLARTVRIGRWAAGLAGAAYMWSGFALSWLVFPEFSAVLAWQPWAWLLVVQYEKIAATNNYQAQRPTMGQVQTLLGIAIVFALCILCHAQLALYIGIGTSLFWLFQRLFVAPRTLGRVVAALGIAGALALLISAIQWLPTLALASESQRAGATTLGTQVSWLNLLVPVIGGRARTTTGWGSPWAAMLMVYVGIGPLLLGLISLWWVRTAQALATAALFGCTILLILLPPSVMQNVPLLNQLPAVDRWGVVLALAVALGAAHGLHHLLDSHREAGVPFNRWAQRGGGDDWRWCGRAMGYTTVHATITLWRIHHPVAPILVGCATVAGGWCVGVAGRVGVMAALVGQNSPFRAFVVDRSQRAGVRCGGNDVARSRLVWLAIATQRRPKPRVSPNHRFGGCNRNSNDYQRTNRRSAVSADALFHDH